MQLEQFLEALLARTALLENEVITFRQLEVLISQARADVVEASTPKNFDAFWKLYPRKVSRVAAANAWRRVGADAAWPQIERNIKQRLANKDWETTPDRKGFIPHPTTYLNQRRWLDEPSTPNLSDKGWSDI